MSQLLGGHSFSPGGDGSVVCCKSRAYVMELGCSGCQHTFDFALWIIIDGDSRPDLLQSIVDGRLHDPLCPRCGHANHINADLLLFTRTPEPVLLFSPDPHNAPEQTQKIGRSFLLKLKAQLGAEWKDEYYEKNEKRGMFVVDRRVLPSLLAQARRPV
jgi:hypothetical protein